MLQPKTDERQAEALLRRDHAGRSVLLVDDVMTSGATAQAPSWRTRRRRGSTTGGSSGSSSRRRIVRVQRQPRCCAACKPVCAIFAVQRKFAITGVLAIAIATGLMAESAITAGTLYQKRFLEPCDVRTASRLRSSTPASGAGSMPITVETRPGT